MFSLRSFFIWVVLINTGTVYSAAVCTLDEVPSPPLRDARANFDILISEVKKQAKLTTCEKFALAHPDGNIVLPIHNFYALIGNMRSKGSIIEEFDSEIAFYGDTPSMRVMSLTKHQQYILDLQNDIQEAAITVGSNCASGVKFSTDIVLPNSTYKTKDKTITQVMTDMYEQVVEILVFYRNLGSNASNEKYATEKNFTIVPAGFSDAMRKFYTAEALQACQDALPQNESIKNMIKKAFSVSWKYPQAFAIWKEAWDLLMYRGSQIIGMGETDPAQEAKIDQIVRAQTGGVGNSRGLINAQFFREFKDNINNKSLGESIGLMMRRLGQETFGDSYILRTVNDIQAAYESKNTPVAPIREYAITDAQARDLLTIERSLYDDYFQQKTKISTSKGQNPLTVTGLVQGLESAESIAKPAEENMKMSCKILDKQGTNITEKKTCRDFMQ